MKGVMIVIVLAALCACTTHTVHYTTDGTRVTEIERTTHIGSTPVGATPPAPLVRGVQEDVPASTGPALHHGNVVQETAPSTDPALHHSNAVQEDVPASTGLALPPDKGGPRGVLSTDSTRQDIP